MASPSPSPSASISPSASASPSPSPSVSPSPSPSPSLSASPSASVSPSVSPSPSRSPSLSPSPSASASPSASVSPSPSPEGTRYTEVDFSGWRSVERFASVQEGKRHTVSSWIPSKHALGVYDLGNGILPTSFSVKLQGSLDGRNWTDLLTNTAINTIVYPADAIPRPVRYLRAVCTAISLGPASGIDVVIVSAT